MRRLLVTLAFALAGTAHAQEPACEPVDIARVRNVDGTLISVHVECPDASRRMHVLQLLCGDGTACDTVRIAQDVADTPSGHASVVDLDHDGLHEVEVRGMCGAGPNCEGDLYRVDAAARRWQHLFTGGYADLQVIDGWLVEGGRASCCAWEFHAWRLDSKATLPLGYDTMELMVRVDAVPDGEEGNVRHVACTFLRPSGDNAQTVAPPSSALERLCEHYGEPYRLTPPDPTPDAAMRRQEH